MTRNNRDQSSENRSGRRSFLVALWTGLGVVALAEIFWLVFSFLRPLKQKAVVDDHGNIVTAGPVDSFAVGTVTAFPRGQFYLCRMDDGGFLAVSRQCTHLGCTVPWIEKDMKFKCPCHASEFDIAGSVIESPAPRALDIYELYIENKIVKVDTGRRIKRTEFRKSQVVYPKAAT